MFRGAVEVDERVLDDAHARVQAQPRELPLVVVQRPRQKLHRRSSSCRATLRLMLLQLSSRGGERRRGEERRGRERGLGAATARKACGVAGGRRRTGEWATEREEHRKDEKSQKKATTRTSSSAGGPGQDTNKQGEQARADDAAKPGQASVRAQTDGLIESER